MCFTSKELPDPLLLCSHELAGLGQQFCACSVTDATGVEHCCSPLRSWEQQLLLLSGFLVWLWTALSASSGFLCRDFCLGSPWKLPQMYFRSKFWIYTGQNGIWNTVCKRNGVFIGLINYKNIVCRFKASWWACDWGNWFSCSAFFYLDFVLEAEFHLTQILEVD